MLRIPSLEESLLLLLAVGWVKRWWWKPLTGGSDMVKWLYPRIVIRERLGAPRRIPNHQFTIENEKNGKKSRSPCNPKKNGPVAPIPPSCWLSWSSPWCPALWPAGSDPEVGRYPAGGLSPNFTDPFEEHYCQEYSKVSFKSQMVEKPRFVECRTGPIKEIPSLPLESPLIYYINLAKKTLQTRWDRVYEMHRASIQPWGEVIWTRKTFHKYQLYPLNLLLDSNWINTKYTTIYY